MLWRNVLKFSTALDCVHIRWEMFANGANYNHLNIANNSIIERSGSGVELRTLDYENPGSNPVLWG